MKGFLFSRSMLAVRGVSSVEGFGFRVRVYLEVHG